MCFFFHAAIANGNVPVEKAWENHIFMNIPVTLTLTILFIGIVTLLGEPKALNQLIINGFENYAQF